jgi:hypothetical protein
LVRHCIDLAADTANRTGRDREELFEHVRGQERYGEQAFEDHNQALYRECLENLQNYAGYLDQLLAEAQPEPVAHPARVAEDEARDDLERFRQLLSVVWKRVRSHGRAELEAKLSRIAEQARGLSQRVKSEPRAVLREIHRLGAEVEQVDEQFNRGQQPDAGAGLLEGSP